jgi:hypothetical protein
MKLFMSVFAVAATACLISPVFAQEQKNELSGTPDHPSYTATKSSGSINTDGTLNETAWRDATTFKIPFEYMPGDNVPAPVETDFLITFDESYLYMAFRCYDPDPAQIRAHLMDRDAINTFIQDDHVTVLIDFFNDERRAFQFRVNPLGVQADAIFSELEGYEDFSWDAIWNSKGKITDFGWVVEISIPFNQLRFPRTDEVQTWGISAQRSYPRTVRHRMASHKRKRDINSELVQLNKVTGFTGMKTGLNMEIDPTMTAIRTDERSNFPYGDIEDGEVDVEPGVSFRWGITPSMILNAAVNPDFSQVEADVKQLEVNQRFAVRYPEKRPFFLEGADFFLTPIEAVFTRTVADPDAGLKFTGKSGRNAIGAFSTQDRLNNLMIPSNQGSQSTSLDQDITGGVFRFRRDVGQGSALGALYTGRLGDDYYNHVAGTDGFFRLSNTKTISFHYLHSETDYAPEVSANYGQAEDAFSGDAYSFEFNHQSREWGYYLTYDDLSPDFRADFGYVPRVDLRTTELGLSRNIWGEEDNWYDLISVGSYGGATFDYDENRTDSDIHAYASYSGPLQTNFYVIGALKQELYVDTEYDLKQAMVQLDMKPRGGVRLYMMTHFGDMIDYSNLRLAWHIILNPAVELNLGKHLNLNLRHRYMRLSDQGNEIFTANLSQANLVYNFNVRTFVRAIVQYQDISSNPAMYNFAVLPEHKTIFTQFLFSYKLNPQTVLFMGYSDNHLGYSGIDIVQQNRTFFVKLGYAWLL